MILDLRILKELEGELWRQPLRSDGRRESYDGAWRRRRRVLHGSIQFAFDAGYGLERSWPR